MFEIIKNCRVCGEPNPKIFFDLGAQPPPDILLKRQDDAEKKYPLSLAWCPSCRLVQLDCTVSPEELFSHYVWVTGTARGTKEYAERFYKELIERVLIPKDGYVLEIASNDGTFLRPFIRGGYTVLGVDPAKNLAEVAEQEGIPTKAVFWGVEEAKKVREERGLAHVIFARNVLPHVANTVDFIGGLCECLHEEGVLVIEAHYAKIILNELHYDSIYHEHLCYFTLKSLERLLNDAGLYIFDIMKSPISGGSVVVYVKKEKTKENPLLAQYRAEEENEKVNEFFSWQGFAEKSRLHRDKFLKMLRDAVRGGVVIGWGASARSSTMLNFAGVNADIIPAIIDLNPLKQGFYTAGTHIPIVPPDLGMGNKPTCVVILAWNFKDEIIDTLKKEYGFGGRCIIPLPGEPRLIEI